MGEVKVYKEKDSVEVLEELDSGELLVVLGDETFEA